MHKAYSRGVGKRIKVKVKRKKKSSMKQWHFLLLFGSRLDAA